jgi:hypothetical chaperone protein
LSKFVCGIDFGTSNTAIALANTENQQVTLVPVEGTQTTIPSALFFKQTETLLGRQALSSYIAGDEGRFMRSLKRVLGTSLMQDGTDIAGKKQSFSHIIGEFIGAIKTTAERHAGTELHSVVAGRPVHFIDHNEQADQEAENQLRAIYQSVGFKNIHFQYEPIAAAFAHEAELDEQERLALVIDIGGGTSDFTIIRLSKRYMNKIERQDDILANTGIRVGGNDFDHALSMACFMPLLGFGTQWLSKNIGETKELDFPAAPFVDLSEWSKIHFMYAPKYKRDIHRLGKDAIDKQRIGRLLTVIDHELGHRLMGTIEDCKIALSDSTTTMANLAYIEAELQAPITRRHFEQSLDNNLERIQRAIHECCVKAGVKAEEINLIILTGGGTSIPIVRGIVRDGFPQADISEGNRLSSVGLGLAYDAKRRYVL